MGNRETERQAVEGRSIAFSWTDADGAAHGGRVTNIGPGGIAVAVAEPPPLDQPIDFELRLDGTKTIRGTGRIAWSRTEGQAGVCFVSVDEHARSLLELWLRRGRPLRRGS